MSATQTPEGHFDVTLSILDRIHLLNLIPRTGSVLTLRVVRELEQDLSFTAEEITAWHIEQDGQALKWRATDDQGQPLDTQRVYTLSDAARSLIRKALQEMDTRQELTVAHLPLYDRFVA